MSTPAPPIPWRRLLGWFLVSRVLIWLVAGASLRFARKGRFFTPPENIFAWLKQWDAAWYLDIVHRGYAFDPERMSNVNFLPLYPLLVRALGWVVRNIDVAGYLVSNVLCLGAAILLWRLMLDIAARPAAADAAVLFFLFGPVSFFFATIYSEATFAFGAIASLLAARHERWLLAGLCGAGAALTRSVGVLLVIPLAIAFVQQHPTAAAWREPRTWLTFLCCALPAAGLALYVVFLAWRFGEPRAFFISQGHSGHGYSYLWDLLNSRHFNQLPLFYQVWFGAAALAGAGLLLAGALLRQPLALTALALASCLLHFSIKTLESMPRYLSVVIPFYCTLGLIAARWPQLGRGMLAVSVALLVLSVTLFVNGYWFT